jgi:uncharacterized protein YdeI (YjbR/CyaY-like superfamily)
MAAMVPPAAPRPPAGDGASGPTGPEQSSAADGLPLLTFTDVTQFDAWVVQQSPQSPGCWLRIPRAGSGAAGPSYDQALDVAIRHGWIDGRKGAGDERFWLQRFTPRRAGSRWSRANRDRAERAESAGLLAAGGTAAVAAARADGRWDSAYEGPARAQVPADLQAALDAAPAAQVAFDSLDAGNRYAVLYRVEQAKRESTRASRIARFVNMLEHGQVLHPPRTRASDPRR